MSRVKTNISNAKYSDNNVTIQVTVDLDTASRLNQRQLWFLGRLQRGDAPHADAIAKTWGVTLRTARRDVAALVALKLARFVGPNKTGHYELKKS